MLGFSSHLHKDVIHFQKKARFLLKRKLWAKVLLGLFLGVIFGFLLGPDLALVTPETSGIITTWLAFPGNLFLQLIKMIIIPLIFSSIIVGIISSGDPNFLKKVGPKIATYFVFTTIVATIIAFFVAGFIQPGQYIDTSSLSGDVHVEGEEFEFNINDIPDRIISVLPSNPLESMLNGDMLGVVLFTILFGVALLFTRKKSSKSTTELFSTIQQASMTIVNWAMILAPYAVFGLMTRVSSQVGLEIFLGLGMYIVTVFFGLLILFIFYLCIVGLASNHKVLDFVKNIAPVQLLAFSTSSSAAAMPLSMKTAEEKLKIRPAISRFIIPIGSTINMDGTALYQVVAVMFLAQAFEIAIPFTGMLLIIAITVGASIGAPAAPGVGIVIVATILESIGIPGSGLALILGVDRILDMSRTAVNVSGDLTACTFFDKRIKA